MSEQDKEQTAAQERPAIVLTDADEPVLFKASDPCPRCGAGPKLRQASNGFGRTFREQCGQCGFSFGERTRQ